MTKRTYALLSAILLLSVLYLPVAAAEGEVGVNLPGWVGWLMAITALVLPLIVSFTLRRRGSL